jgi:hypothetical protein
MMLGTGRRLAEEISRPDPYIEAKSRSHAEFQPEFPNEIAVHNE